MINSEHLTLKVQIWHIFCSTNPFVDVCDKPIRDIELDSDAFSEAKPISVLAFRSKSQIPVIIIHHHSPGPGTALFLSHILLALKLAVCSSQPSALFLHRVHHTRGGVLQ